MPILTAAGSIAPLCPKAGLIKTMVGRPVRVPIFPISTSGIAPTKEPSTIINNAFKNVISGTNSIPVKTVVTTTLAPIHMENVEKKPILLLFIAIGCTSSWARPLFVVIPFPPFTFIDTNWLELAWYLYSHVLFQ
jgi:hypothetical protein